MAKLIHTMIRVLEEERSTQFYETAFGLKVADRYDFDGFTLIYLSNPETEHELELTVNKGQEGPYDLGNGYGHLAFSVQSLEEEHARLKAEGLNPKDIKEIAHQGTPLGRFFFIEDPDGYKIEVLERRGRFK
ncbi:VOC family protein [Lutibaculum baratangense]|uniref:Aldoketomutase n=1 Tax=Lutibaculum baratangense AMV1 TaxID=631454 RepID=V4TM36_9HYPH|nr:VOC family protein [Lutibaculum baratangense]ESR26833.1 Lactoylglutathione lyase [Lutibaculum baratangense AMV1]